MTLDTITRGYVLGFNYLEGAAKWLFTLGEEIEFLFVRKLEITLENFSKEDKDK